MIFSDRGDRNLCYQRVLLVLPMTCEKNSLSFLLKYFFGAVRVSCVATLWILFPLFSLVGRFKTVAGRGDKVLSLNSRANYSSNLMFSCFLSILFFVLQALADAMASKFQIFRPRHGNVFGWGKWIHNLPYDPIAPPMPRPCLNLKKNGNCFARFNALPLLCVWSLLWFVTFASS